MKKNVNYNDKLPPIRILLLDASDIYFAEKTQGLPLDIKNGNARFDKRFKDQMPLNLDLYYLFEKDKLVLKSLKDEFYTYCIINVRFKYPLYINDKGDRVYDSNEANKKASKTRSDIRKELYLNGFHINGKKYVRYKRSASSAREGTCLFIREDLFGLMDTWSKTGLIEAVDKKAFESLTSYEAYRALSLSSLVKTIYLNPYNILFVKDFKHVLKNQSVVKVSVDENNSLVASKEVADVENNIFDGEGLLDLTVFKKCGYPNKGMMLLRNRFFKCCAFNTNLQAWFKHNKINSIDELNGYTCASKVEDIVLVVSESCLKYFKMAEGGYSLDNVKRWCDAVSDKETQLSRFGIVKTDKETRFFDGDMVETTYQLINTLQLSQNTDCRLLLSDYIDYANKIRNIKETPEYARLFLHGELDDDSIDLFDDSEDVDYEEEIFDFSWYSFKSKVCFDLIAHNSQFVGTKVFKNHIFKDIINNFRLKIYDGRVLVHGTYATIFGNPVEYLKYIIKKDSKPLFDEKHLSSTLDKDEICSSFFKDGEEIVGSRAPHMTMGNLLYAKNRHIPEINKWFNLTRNIVVVDAINNNIQQRLNGMDYDSDTVLLTNNNIIVNATKLNYDNFPVPFAAFDHDDKALENFKEAKNKKENRILNLWSIDNKISNNKVGEIVNLAQKYNSHLWNNLNPNPKFDYEELYNEICILSVLAGAEIDSSKRTFAFNSTSELTKAREFGKENGYVEKPAFFYYVAPGKKDKPRISKIDKYVLELPEDKFFQTSMDYLWGFASGVIDAPDTNEVEFTSLIFKNINTRNLSQENYRQIKRALTALINTRDIINDEKKARNKASYDVERANFNIEIAICYDQMKAGISNIQKTKVLIRKIYEEKTPHSLLYYLLYIISLKEKELGYGYEDLFENDGGVPALERTNKKNAQFDLFGEYYYKRSSLYKAISSIRLFKEEE